jgi:hypothetical protein
MRPNGRRRRTVGGEVSLLAPTTPPGRASTPRDDRSGARVRARPATDPPRRPGARITPDAAARQAGGARRGERCGAVIGARRAAVASEHRGRRENWHAAATAAGRRPSDPAGLDGTAPAWRRAEWTRYDAVPRRSARADPATHSAPTDAQAGGPPRRPGRPRTWQPGVAIARARRPPGQRIRLEPGVDRLSPSDWLPVLLGTFAPRPSVSIRSSQVRVRGAEPAPAHLARPPGTYTFDEYYSKEPWSSEAS